MILINTISESRTKLRNNIATFLKLNNIRIKLDFYFLGKGVVYGYDPVGCMEKLGHAAGGAGVAIMAPLLDNQVGKLNMVEPETGNKVVKRLPTLDEGEFIFIKEYFKSK